MTDVTFIDNSGQVKAEFKNKLPTILEAIGLQAEGNAISEITHMGAVDTGRLRNSITWAAATGQGLPNQQGGEAAKPEDYEPSGTPEKNAVYIGTNVEYAPYIEHGTSKMAARPFLRNAAANYQKEYKDIIKKGLSS